MNDLRKTGWLTFEGPNFTEKLQILWELRSGELIEGKTWVAAISFTNDWEVPARASGLIFQALSDESIKMRFEPEAGTPLRCHVYGIEDLPDAGVITIASPDLPGDKATLRRPKFLDGVA